MNDLTISTFDKYHKYVMPTYAPKVLFVRGKGARLWDAEGNEYLDFATGISVCNLGHCHPAVTKAIQQQAETLVHVSNLFLNNVTPLLAEQLIQNGFDGVVFFCNSGAEANEGMIKFARKIGNASGKNTVIAMENSFHGRTLATLAATGRSKYRKGFEPDMPGFKFVPFNDFDALESSITPDVCAIMMEPVQGEGGIIPADPEYLKNVRQLCDDKGILLLFDEVQCGMGRTGKLYAWQNYGIEPDALSMAKAIANGLPMGAFIVQRKYADTLTVGKHASTFGGTPLVSAAALAVQKAIKEEKLLENCRAMGEYLKDRLEEVTRPYDFVKEIRGMGLMLGVVLDREAATLAGLALKRKLVVLTAGETVLRLLPPLIITRDDADEAVSRIADALAELQQMIAAEKENSK